MAFRAEVTLARSARAYSSKIQTDGEGSATTGRQTESRTSYVEGMPALLGVGSGEYLRRSISTPYVAARRRILRKVTLLPATRIARCSRDGTTAATTISRSYVQFPHATLRASGRGLKTVSFRSPLENVALRRPWFPR